MGDFEKTCLMIAEVKGAERIREKIKEAAVEHGYDATMWPYIQTIGEWGLTLQASMFAAADGALSSCDR